MLDVSSLLTDPMQSSPSLPTPGPPTSSPGSTFAPPGGLRSFSSAAGDMGFLPGIGRQELLEDDSVMEDLGFEFNEEGQIVNTTPKLPPPTRGPGSLTGSIAGPRLDFSMHRAGKAYAKDSRANSEEIAMQVFQEHEAGQDESREHNSTSFLLDFGDNDVTMELRDDALPFSSRGSVAGEQKLQIETAAVKKRNRKQLGMAVDLKTELSSKDIKSWNENYLGNMNIARKETQLTKAKKSAKKIGSALVLEWGIGGKIGNPILNALYSGKAIISAIEGTPWVNEEQKIRGKNGKGSIKELKLEEELSRARDEGRHLEEKVEDIGFGNEENNTTMREEGNVSEIGRDAPDVGSGGGHEFPWNVAGSRAGSMISTDNIFSAGAMPSSSLGGQRFADFSSRRGSASPLAMKGNRLERLSSVDRLLGDVQEEDTAGLELAVDEAIELELFGPGEQPSMRLYVTQDVTAFARSQDKHAGCYS